MSNKQLILTETLAADRTISAAEFATYGVIDFDPGGSARNVDLPAGSAALAGQQVRIRNSADNAETLTVRIAGPTTIATIDQNESAIIYCEGTVTPTYTAVVSKVGAT